MFKELLEKNKIDFRNYDLKSEDQLFVEVRYIYLDFDEQFSRVAVFVPC